MDKIMTRHVQFYMSNNILLFPKLQILDFFEVKKLADNNSKSDKDHVKFSKRGRKHCGIRRNCSLQVFLLFPQCFQKTKDCCHVNT